MRIQASHIYLFILMACALLSLIYISVLPVAWFDEVMDLDPAARWVLTGKHASIAWPIAGSNSICLVNLPLRELPFILATYIFGPHVWSVRLVFFIMALLAAFLFYKVAKHNFSNTSLALFFTILVAMDKGFLEMMRGCRPEVLELVFASALVLFTLRKSNFIAAIICVFAFYLHPASWVFLLLFLVYNFLHIATIQRIWLALIGLTSIALFYLYIQENVIVFFSQFIQSASMHSVKTGFLQNVINHFSQRWWQYWSIEWWWLLAYIGVHIILVLKIKKMSTVSKLLAVSIVLTGLYWFVLLTHNYRYTVFLNGLVALFYMQYLPVIGFITKRTWLQFAMVVLVLFPFIGRVVVAQAHYKQRNPYAVLHWLNTNLPTDSTLLIGESIGAYWSLQHASVTNFAHHTMAQNVNFSAYKNVYLLSRNQKLPISSTYPLRINPKVLGKEIVGKSYAGICLYRISNLHTFNSIVRRSQK